MHYLTEYLQSKLFTVCFVIDSLKYYYDYECNEPLVANAKLSATSSLRDRGPDNAKLYGKDILKT